MVYATKIRIRRTAATKERGAVSAKRMKNVTRWDTWQRLIYMSLFTIFFGLTEVLILIILVVQFISKLVRGEEIERLAQIGGEIGDYFRAIILFLTYRTETMPYPFGEWPMGVESGEVKGETGADNNSSTELAASIPMRTRKRAPRRRSRAAGSSD